MKLKDEAIACFEKALADGQVRNWFFEQFQKGVKRRSNDEVLVEIENGITFSISRCSDGRIFISNGRWGEKIYLDKDLAVHSKERNFGALVRLFGSHQGLEGVWFDISMRAEEANWKAVWLASAGSSLKFGADAARQRRGELLEALTISDGFFEAAVQVLAGVGAQLSSLTDLHRFQKTPCAPKSKSVVAAPGSKSAFDLLPDDGYVRERELVSSSKRPGESFVLPFSSATLWRKVKAGAFPTPLKLSERITAWRVGDVRNWLDTSGARLN